MTSEDALREKRNAAARAWRARNRARVAEFNRAYRAANRDKLRAYDGLRYTDFARRADHLWRLRRCEAEKRSLEFTITPAWVEERLRAGRCEATGLPLEAPVVGGGKHPFAASVDRIDPGRGYTPDNARVVVHIFNLAKNVFTDADVRRMAEAMCSR
jgi:hypothetical protein